MRAPGPRAGAGSRQGLALGVRGRVAAGFALGALLLSAVLALLTWTVARSHLLAFTRTADATRYRGCPRPAEDPVVTVRRPYQIALAVALVALALAIVGVWRIGPVVAVLTATHGVHAGDALAAFPGLAALRLVGHPMRLARPLRYRALPATA